MDKELLKIMLMGLAAVVAVLSIVIVVSRKKGKQNPKGAAASKLATSLRDEKLKSSIILNAIDDGVMLIDDQQTIQLFNPGAASITGWASDEAQGLNWQSVFKFVDDKGRTIDSLETPVARLFAAGDTVRDNTASLLTKSGKTIAVNLVVSPLLDNQKK